MRVLDLFSGVGMFAYGMEKAGHEVVAFCEIEEWPRRVLDKHWPDVPKYTDVRELNRERLGADGVTRIEILTAGFPCQDLSVAGKQAGIHGERSGLFDEIIRLACELRPRYIVLENVSALLTGDSGGWARYVFGRLAEIGFDAEWHVIPAGNPDGLSAGAPHRRERVWIVAHTKRQRQQGQGELVEPCNPASDKDRQAGEPVHVRERNVRSIESSFCLLADGITAGLAGLRWLPEPRVGRVAAGVPDRVQKLKALGNGLVWQIPAAIGAAIMERENNAN